MPPGRPEEFAEVSLALASERLILEIAVELVRRTVEHTERPLPAPQSRTHAATIPPSRVTRASSRSPTDGSAMKSTTSLAKAPSNLPSSNGSSSEVAGLLRECRLDPNRNYQPHGRSS